MDKYDRKGISVAGTFFDSADIMANGKAIAAALRESAAEAYEDAAKGTQKFLVDDGAMMKFRTAVAFWLERKAAALRAPEVKTEEPRRYPCGCVSCVCDCDERCLGCGAKNCGTHPGLPPAPPSPDEKPEQEKPK